MRRLLLIFLMLIVPIQTAWSAGHAVHGHFDRDVASGALHVHDHDGSSHQDADEPDSIADQVGSGTSNHGGIGHPGSHAHPAFAMIPPNCAAGLSYDASELPPPFRSATFTSHIPPLFDRPPAARV